MYIKTISCQSCKAFSPIRKTRPNKKHAISYLSEYILLWDDDISGAFWYNKYHPDNATAFAFILFDSLYVPVGKCFDGNISAQNFEPLAYAITLFVTLFSHDTSRRKKHWGILKHIPYATDINKGIATISRACACSKNKGTRKNKSYSLSKYNMFVDDNLIPEIKTHMQQAMAPSIKALFMALAPDLILIYRSNISMNKFY